MYESTLAVEGEGCLLSDFYVKWEDEVFHKPLLNRLQHLGVEPSKPSVNSHLLAF